MSKVKKPFGSLSVIDLLYAGVQLIFIAFKLAGVGVVANWNWWHVLSPTILIASIFLVILSLSAILAISLQRKS